MLSDDVTALGYTLLCVATPTSDCKVEIISEVSHSCRAAGAHARRFACAQASPTSCVAVPQHLCIPTAAWQVRAPEDACSRAQGVQ